MTDGAASFYLNLISGEDDSSSTIGSSPSSPSSLSSSSSSSSSFSCSSSSSSSSAKKPPNPTNSQDFAEEFYFCDTCERKLREYQRDEHVRSIDHLMKLFEEAPSQFYAISKSNPGYKMLKKLGWTEDSGLGKNRNGALAPLKTRFKNNRKGLGKERRQLRVTHFLAAHPELKDGTFSTAGAETAPPPAQTKRERQKRKEEERFHQKRVEAAVKANDEELRRYLRQ